MADLTENRDILHILGTDQANRSKNILYKIIYKECTEKLQTSNNCQKVTFVMVVVLFSWGKWKTPEGLVHDLFIFPSFSKSLFSKLY